MKNSSLESSKKRLTVLTHAVLILSSLIMVFPFIWMILTCFKTVAESNAVPPVIFPSAFGVFFLRQTYMGIPKEIGEAAYLDGCNQWQTFYKVMFPLTGTSVAALTIFTQRPPPDGALSGPGGRCAPESRA